MWLNKYEIHSRVQIKGPKSHGSDVRTRPSLSHPQHLTQTQSLDPGKLLLPRDPFPLVCMCVNVYACVYMCGRTYMHVCIYMYKHVRVCVRSVPNIKY